MKNYILRIYRDAEKTSGQLVGTLEDVDGKGKKKAFTSIDELWDILKATRRPPPGRRPGEKKKLSPKQG
ncbi:MAG: hypothetical protein P8Y66_03695 [Nitrospirota bacterium]|jgi:hypothetical protein